MYLQLRFDTLLNKEYDDDDDDESFNKKFAGYCNDKETVTLGI